MSKSSVIIKCAIGYVCLVGLANAAVSEDSPAPAVQLGAITAYPGFTVLEKRDSNPFRTNVAKGSTVSVLSPSVMLETKRADQEYSLNYRADAGMFSGSSADNYIDHSFLGSAVLPLSMRASVNIRPEYKIGHDDRGSLPGVAASRNDWQSKSLSGSFQYGAEESKAKIVLDAGYVDRQYQNNRAVTAAMDKNTTDIGAAFHYRVMPKTTMFLQATNTGIAYKLPGSTLNGSEQRYMAGVTWDATAQTSGSFKLGMQQKKFNAPSTRPNFSGTGWEGNARWSPRDYARADLMTSRKTSESTGVGNFVLVTNSTLDFGYDLTSRTTLHVNAIKMTEDFSGAGRVDNTNTFGLKAEYKVLKWVTGIVEYSDAKKKSSAAINDYSRKILAVSLRSDL
jgi:hypothetical protein